MGILSVEQTLFAQSFDPKTGPLLSGAAVAYGSGQAVNTPQITLAIARPVCTMKNRPSDLAWIDAYIQEYLYFRLNAIIQLRVCDPDTLLACQPDYRAYARTFSEEKFRSCAERLGASHLLKADYSLSQGNSTAEISLTLMPASGGQGEVHATSAASGVDTLGPAIDSAILQLLSGANVELDANAAKFFKTKIAGSGKCSKGTGSVVVGIYKEKSPNHRRAAEDLKKCASQDDGELLAYFISAREYAKAKDFKSAAAALKEMIFKLGPSYSALYPVAARYFRLSDQNENALQMIKVGEGLGLSTHDLVLEAAAIYKIMDDEAGAVKASEEVLSFDPTNFDALLYLMARYNKQNKPDQALACANRFIEQYPSDGRGHLEAGKAYAAQQETASAMTELAKAAKMLPNNAEPPTLLGDLSSGRRKFSDALEQYERALSIKGEDIDLSVKIGDLYLQMERPELTIEKLKGVKKKYYDHSALLRVIGLAEYRTGDLAQARTDLSRYVDNGPPDRNAFLALGEIEEQQGKYGRAKELYEKAALLDKSDPEPPRRLSALLQKTGGKGYGAGEGGTRDSAAYAPGKISLRLTMGIVSSIVCAGGIGAGVLFNNQIKKDYDEYKASKNTDRVNSLHKSIKNKELLRALCYGLGGAAGIGLTLTIVLHSKGEGGNE